MRMTASGPGIGEAEIGRHAAAAMRLDGAVDDVQHHFRATTLIIAISACAALLPTVSIICAAFSVSSRACSISMRDRRSIRG